MKHLEPTNSLKNKKIKNWNQLVLKIQYFQRIGISQFFKIPFFVLPKPLVLWKITEPPNIDKNLV